MTSPTFDPSLIEIFVTLVLGGTLIIPSKTLIKATNYLYKSCFLNDNIPNIEYNKNNNIDLTLMMTPSHLLSFDKRYIRNILMGKTNVKNLVLGGEKFPSLNTLIDIILDGENNFESISHILGISIWNIYGITENSVWASLYKVETVDFFNCIKYKRRIRSKTSNDNIIIQNVNNNNDSRYNEQYLRDYTMDNVSLGLPLINTTLLLRYIDIDGLEKTVKIYKDITQYQDNKIFQSLSSRSDLFSLGRVSFNEYIIGELWIGGNRQCWVDLDENYKCGEYIFTGDIVIFNKTNRHLYHYGRLNQQIKYSGYRIN